MLNAAEFKKIDNVPQKKRSNVSPAQPTENEHNSPRKGKEHEKIGITNYDDNEEQN